MKTIKIIDLLNKIAIGEAPEKIKYQNSIFNKYNDIYLREDQVRFFNGVRLADLNNEVEIIEEPEANQIEQVVGLNTFDSRRAAVALLNKLNEVIRVVNKLQEKEKEMDERTKI